jgi:hypothetical protein
VGTESADAGRVNDWLGSGEIWPWGVAAAFVVNVIVLLLSPVTERQGSAHTATRVTRQSNSTPHSTTPARQRRSGATSALLRVRAYKRDAPIRRGRRRSRTALSRGPVPLAAPPDKACADHRRSMQTGIKRTRESG